MNKILLSTMVVVTAALVSITASAKEKVLYSCNEDQQMGGNYGSLSYDQNGITIRVNSKTFPHGASEMPDADDDVTLAYRGTTAKVMNIKGQVQLTNAGLILTLPQKEVQLKVVFDPRWRSLTFYSDNRLILDKITENTGYGVSDVFPNEAHIGLGDCLRIK